MGRRRFGWHRDAGCWAARQSALRGLFAAVHVAGDHNPDCLDPAGDITDTVEATFGKQLLIARRPGPGRIRPALIHAQELKAFVVLITAFPHT